MGFLDFLFGKSGKSFPVQTMTGEQSDLLKQLLSGLSGPLSSGLGNLQALLGGGEEAYKAYEAPAMRQFNEQIIPGIAARFSGLGAGAQGSSAFPQALSQAGASLSENLAAQRAGLQSQALSQLLGFLGQGLGQQSFQYQQRQPDLGFIRALLNRFS